MFEFNLGKELKNFKNKELLESYWIKDGYCRGCVYDGLNKLCPHYKPVKVFVAEVIDGN